MCRFTFIRHLGCGCEYVSTTPEDTELCPSAMLEGGLIQEIDKAAPACLTTNIEDAAIACRQERLGRCIHCRPIPLERPRGEEVLILSNGQQIQLPVTEFMADHSVVNAIGDSIEASIKECTKITQSFERYKARNPGAMRLIHSGRIRALLDLQEHVKYGILFFQPWDLCRDMVPHLRMLVRKRAPKALYTSTLKYLETSIASVRELMKIFQDFHKCLCTYEPSRPVDNFNGSEERLRFLVERIRYSSCLPVQPDPKHYLHPEFVMDRNLEMRIERVQENLFRNLCLLNTRPAHHPAAPRPSFARNRHNLGFKMPPQLLDDAPAREVEVQPTYFVEGESADIEGESGNPTTIFANPTKDNPSRGPSPSPAEPSSATPKTAPRRSPAKTKTPTSRPVPSTSPGKKRKRTPPSPSGASASTAPAPLQPPVLTGGSTTADATNMKGPAPAAAPVAPSAPSPLRPAESPLRRSTRARREPVRHGQAGTECGEQAPPRKRAKTQGKK